LKDIFRVAIDGPGGAGKSTVAKEVAHALGIDYIDTGAMYRAVGYKIIRDGIDPGDEKAVEKMLSETDIDFVRGTST
jgi:cytidylate kinase